MAHEQAPSGARASARPKPNRRMPGALLSAKLAARATPRGAREITTQPHTGTSAQLEAAKRSLLVTFRRDGTPVPTPVWTAPNAGVLYVRSERASGKLKRLRNNPRLLVAPCTAKGKPLGAPLQATARVLGSEQETIAEHTLAARFGLGRALFERMMDLLRVDMCYLEITPGSWD